MTRIATKVPLGLKAPKAAKKSRKPMRRVPPGALLKVSRPHTGGKAHMARVAQLPCVICVQHGYHQTSRTTVHHVICGRFSTHKSSDFDTIPLCEGHHQGMFDTSKTAIHRGKQTWVELYGPDTDYLPVVADMLAGEWNE